MNKEFLISIRRPGEAGAATASQVTLPASWEDLTDALDQARVYDEEQIYSVTVLKAKRNFLVKHIPSYANLYELNYLAERLAMHKEWENDSFEALVKMDETKGKASPIPMERLINLTYSTSNCHYVREITNDRELGEFVLENGLREDLTELSEESISLLDREAIGREHRDATRGVITAAGYFESFDGEISTEYQRAKNIRPEKPDYIFRIYIAKAAFSKEQPSESGLKLKLPADPIMVETILKTLHAPEWENSTCNRLDSIISGLKDMPIDLNELAQINELALCIKSIEEGGQLPKYKALLTSIESNEAESALQLAKEIDEFSFYPEMAGPADYADHILAAQHEIRPGDSWYPYIDRYGYGCSVMDKDNVKQTAYGFIKRSDGGPILLGKDDPESVMELHL
ncbi:MAG: hypothetical protein EOM59_06630 [Clostridia bacterium]|nr:hypothetical protein [Clostridia bacterium]